MKTLCDLLECPRSTYYYEPRDKDEAELIAAMEEIMMRWPRYGYRRILAQLKREPENALCGVSSSFWEGVVRWVECASARPIVTTSIDAIQTGSRGSVKYCV